MATQLQLVNRVLQRLRESKVGSVATTAYSTLIALLLNEAKEHMEQRWFWTVYDTTIDTSILSDGTLTYDLTQTTDKSFLLRQGHEDRLPMAFDITDNEESQLFDIPLKERNRYRDTWRGTVDDSAAPKYFSIQPDSDGRGYTLALPHGSNTSRTWRTYWYVPQADLAIDGTDDNTEILLPEYPLFWQTYYMAALERGEEIGTPVAVLRDMAHDALFAAIELDMQVHKNNENYTFTNLENLRNQMYGNYE